MEHGENLTMHRQTLTIEGERKLYNYTFSEGKDRFHELMSLAEHGTAEAVGDFLNEHPDTPLERGDHPTTPLHLAAKRGKVETIRELATRGASLERVDLDYGSTPLGWACFYGQSEAVHALLELGARIHESCVPNAEGGLAGTLGVHTGATKQDYERILEILKKN